MIVLHHSELIDPVYRAKSLYVPCLLIHDKVPHEQALAQTLGESIMAFSRARCSATGSAECTRSDARDGISTWTLQFHEVDSSSIAEIELFVDFISGCFHIVKNVESPVDSMEVIRVVIRAHVAHSSSA